MTLDPKLTSNVGAGHAARLYQTVRDAVTVSASARDLLDLDQNLLAIDIANALLRSNLVNAPAPSPTEKAVFDVLGGFLPPEATDKARSIWQQVSDLTHGTPGLSPQAATVQHPATVKQDADTVSPSTPVTGEQTVPVPVSVLSDLSFALGFAIANGLSDGAVTRQSLHECLHGAHLR